MPFQKGHPVYKGVEKGWFKKGFIPWIKGKKLSEEHKEKLRQAKFKNPTRYWLGKKRSDKTRIKISQAQKGKPLLLSEESRKKRGERIKGKKNYNWKGGITSLVQQIRHHYKYRQWRSDVFTRDDFTCQECEVRGGKLHAHHKDKSFSGILEEYKIKTLEEALDCEELWNINNGITMCQKCHYKKHIKKLNK